MTYYVYQHVSPINKVYVGITNNPTIRFSGKGSRYCTYNSIFSKVIKKYGWDNIQHEILISNTTFEKACIIEKALIKFYKKRNISYNITNGGEGTLGREVTEQTRFKMRCSAKGPSKKTIAAVKNSLKVKESAVINLIKARKVWIGNNHTAETIQKLKESAIGRRPSMEAVNNSALINSVPIAQVDDNGIIIDTFKSIKEASIILNLNASSIQQVVSGKRNSLFTLKFKKI